MGWANFLIIDALIIILALIYYRNRPKPKWLSRDIAIAKAVAKFFYIMKLVRANVWI